MSLERILRDYAHKLVADHFLERDYKKQIGKWIRSARLVADAHDGARDNVRDVLTDIAQKKQAERERLLFAVTLAAGLPLRWLSAAVSTKYAPKFLGAGAQGRITIGVSRIGINPKVDYNKVAASFFGGAALDLSKAARDLGVGALKFDSKEYDFNTASLKKIGTEGGSFKTQLINSMEEQKEVAVERIMQLAWEIEHSSDKLVGEWIAKVDKTSAAAERLLEKEGIKRDSREKEKSKESLGKHFVNKWLDGYRKEWAKSWFYYGNDPDFRSVEEMAKVIEREIWALWILDQKFKPARERVQYVQGHAIRTRHGGKLPDELILDRLAQLYVMRGRSTSAAIAQGAHRANEILRGRDYRDIKDPPLADFGDFVNAGELKQLLNWARSHKPDTLAGSIKSKAREIVPLEKAYGK